MCELENSILDDIMDETNEWAKEKIYLIRMQEALKLRIKKHDEDARELGVPTTVLDKAMKNKLNDWSLSKEDKQTLQKCENFWEEFVKLNTELVELIK